MGCSGWIGASVPGGKSFCSAKPFLCEAREILKTRNRIYLQRFSLLESRCVAVSYAGPGSRARRFQTLSGFLACCPLLEQALHAQSKPHVARDTQLAGHECHLAIELAAQHVQVVLGGHRDGDAR